MRKLKPTLLLILSLSAFAIGPDLLFGFLNENYQAGYDLKSNAITLLLMVLIALSPAKKLSLIVLTILALMQATQLMYFQYFGGFYSAFDMVLMTSEIQDTIVGFADIFTHILPLFILSLVFYAIAVLSYIQYEARSIKVPFLHFFLILLLTLPFFQSLRSEASQKYQPNIAHTGIKNGLYSVSFFVARQIKVALGMRKEMPDYAPYELIENEPVDANIVVLMGESLSYYNMGLFGYERNTTPNLEPYKSNPNFFFIPAISSAVSTRVSLTLFFNGIYEPNNTAQISSMEGSLFRLAKKKGFNTHYITTQKNAGGLTYSFSLSDIDTWKENKHLSGYEGEYDNRLLLELKSMNLNYEQPQFITLHMRSTHVPYVDNYPKSEEVYPTDGKSFADYQLNSYDNSVIYTQKVIANIYKYFETTHRPTYIFFIPDHGELLGQGGRYGHNSVDIDMARVPFLFYGINIPTKETERLKSELGCLSNHYQISHQIAQLLGYQINNPNEKETVYYLNGTDVFGEAGYMSYDLEAMRKETCGALSNGILYPE
ncbi:phosphoethanolamine transferase [Bermanella marisrubri]|uniref:DcaA n=1 Tax=Bermanella marisrubri TaxID=207949 RepID=Q1MZ59_9GAMM|nr:phosphoethanolamine transferase [Bermanella marisrubri]EAT11274.1 DcaA [Oceanobacter sp. RED65] [Bermanella marisrubri]QIZ82756.1 phosphoethanolamine transferase [Bermanella marisrubri]